MGSFLFQVGGCKTCPNVAFSCFCVYFDLQYICYRCMFASGVLDLVFLRDCGWEERLQNDPFCVTVYGLYAAYQYSQRSRQTD